MNKDSKTGAVRFLAQRVWAHLTRSRARGGWIMALICILIYATYGNTWPWADAVEQASLMVASVALGAIALPELSANLWTVSSNDVENLIPTSKVSQLQRALISAQVKHAELDEDWADGITQSVIEPLVATQPHQVLRSLSYHITVVPDAVLTIGGKTAELQEIETNLHSIRQLSEEVSGNVFWIALARGGVEDKDYLFAEFRNANCLAREVSSAFADATDEEWEALMRDLSGAEAMVDGQVIVGRAETSEDVGEAAPGVVRWYFESADLKGATQRPTTFRISFHYPECRTVNNFPVLFPSYYITGGLYINFKVRDPGHDLHHEAFLATVLPRVVTKPKHQPSRQGPSIALAVHDREVVFPGSGVHFWWTPKSGGRGA